MFRNIFCLIKTCALISNSLFYSVELVTFSLEVNAQCQSNMASIKQMLRSCPWKFYWYELINVENKLHWSCSKFLLVTQEKNAIKMQVYRISYKVPTWVSEPISGFMSKYCQWQKFADMIHWQHSPICWCTSQALIQWFFTWVRSNP